MSKIALSPDRLLTLPEGATMAVWRLADLDSWSAETALERPEVGSPPEPLYRSDGKWLHPLFDLLESGLLDCFDGKHLFPRDRIVGRAAAFLILPAGIRDAWADLASDGAFSLFEAAGARLGWTDRVGAIGCQTEALLHDVDDPELAWRLLLERRAATRTG